MPPNELLSLSFTIKLPDPIVVCALLAYGFVMILPSPVISNGVITFPEGLSFISSNLSAPFSMSESRVYADILACVHGLVVDPSSYWESNEIELP